LHWLSHISDEQSCEARINALPMEFSQFEEVPYARHWFVRNGWPNFINLKFYSLCLVAAPPTCTFVPEPIKPTDGEIIIALKPVMPQAES